MQPQATVNKKVIGPPSVQNSASSKSRPSERQLLAQTTTEKTRQQSQANHHKKVEKRPATKSTSSSESKNCETLKRRNTEPRPETEEVQVKRKKTDVTIVRVQRVEREETLSNHNETEDQSPAATKQNEKEPLDCSSEGESVGTMLREGTQVEARVDGSQWYKGKVFAAKPKGSLCRVRVKFDLYPKDKYDKWFDHPSDVLRVLQSVESPARQSPSPQRELPTTTTFEAQNNQVQEVKHQNTEQGTVHSPVDNSVSSMSDATRVEDSPTEQQFAGMLRRCLSFFTPPHYRITKESIKDMDLNELKEFPLEEFFDNYEKGLSEVVKKLQTERDEATRKANAAEEQLKQLTDDKRKLLNLRRNASKLLRYIQEDPNDSTISAEDVSDKVDEMIGTLAQQIERRS